MRTDFENLQDGDRVLLYPNSDNPLHSSPVMATHRGGYYYCDGSDLTQGPDYYFNDVARYNVGFTSE